jgi:rod shape-determining protein MreD
MKEIKDIYPVILVHGYLLILFIIGAMDVGLFQTGSAKPAFFLIGLYGALLLRPHFMPQWAVFIYGFLYDCLYGMPIGVYIFIMLGISLIIDSGRRYLQGQSWPVIWSGFILTYGAVLILEIIIFWLFYNVPMDASGVAGRLLMSAISFPIFFIPFLWIDRWLKHHD